MKKTLKFLVNVLDNLESSTIYCLVFVLFLIISFIMSKLTKNIVLGICVLLGGAMALYILVHLLGVVYDAITDIIETIDYVRHPEKNAEYYTHPSKLWNSQGYMKLKTVLEDAGEIDVVLYLSRSEFNLPESGHFTASLACHKKITLFYPPLTDKWYIIIRDFETDECYRYEEG